MSVSRTCAKCGSLLPAQSALDVCPPCVASQIFCDGAAADETLWNDVMATAGERIGRYRLLEKIGEGGCGIVYMAEQEEPVRRKVALKLIKPGMDTRAVIARFETERQALAMMDHPNIAKVHDGGVTKHGRPYFVMELVRGARITEYCQDHGLDIRGRLDLFMAVCLAIQHAHQKGVVHRDIKPSNILVTEIDGRPAPKVIDFGIARATEQKLTDKTFFTQFAQFLGTPAYMSPEQAALTGTDIDTRSDIYSLGVLLYELLTGTTPFDARELIDAGFDGMRRVICETEPPKPSTRLTQSVRVASRSSLVTRHFSLPSDLDWIVLKCLEKDRARRYESASALAADLARHLHSEPVIARPPGRMYTLGKFVRRHRFAVGAGAAVAVTLLAGIATSALLLLRERTTRSRAESAETAAKALASENQNRLLRLQIDNGARHMAEGNLMAALPPFVEAFKLDARPENEAAHQFRLASIFQQCPRPLQMWFHAGPVTFVRLSPDGKRALSLTAGETSMHDTETGLLLGSVNGGSASGEAAFAPDGLRAVIGAAPPFVWDFSSSPPAVREMETKLPLIAPRWNPDSTRFVFRTGKHEAVLWDAIAVRSIGVLAHPSAAVVLTAIFAPPDRAGAADNPPPAELMALPEIVLTSDDAGVLRAWHPLTGALLTERKLEPKAPPWSMAEGEINFLLTAQNGSDPRTMAHARVWNLAAGRAVGEPLGHDAAIKGAAFAPGVAVTWSSDGTARVWDTATAGLRVSPFRHESEITTASLSRDEFRLLLATGCADGTVRVWNRTAGRPIGPPMLHHSPVRSVAFGPAMHVILTGCADGTVRLWNLAAAATLVTSEHTRPGQSTSYGHTWGTLHEMPDGLELTGLTPGEPRRIPFTWRGKFRDVATAVSRDGRQLLVSQEMNDGLECQLISITGEAEGPAFTLPGQRERGTSKPWVPLGKRRVFRNGNTLEVWDPATGQRVGAPLELPERPHSPMVSPDGRTLLWASEGRVFVWDVDAATERRTPITAAEAAELPVASPGMDSGPIQPVEFSAAGDRFLTTSEHRKNGVFYARVWATATGRAVLPPLRHDGSINSAAFSADDRWIVTTADDRSARVWDAQTGEPRTRAIPHPDNVQMASFSHDQRRVYTICADGYARLWDAESGEPLAAPVGHPVPVINSPYVIPLLGGRLMHTTWTYNMRWKLPDARQPVAEWEAVAELLSGQRREPAGARPLTREELRELWTSVRTRMPNAFTTSLAQREDWNRWMTQWCFGIERKGDAVEFLNEVVALEPDIFLHRWNRAYAHKSRNDWDAVAEDLKVASQLAPQENAVWADLALAELVRGDLAGYRTACAEMASRLSPADRFYHIGEWCAIAADAPNPPEVCQKLLDLLKRLGPPEETASEEKRFWYHAALGMLTFRLGRDVEALEHLETAQEILNGDRIVMLIMAMVHHRLGDPDKARTLRDIVRERIDSDERVYLTGRSFDSHANLAVCRLLLKEAEEMKSAEK